MKYKNTITLAVIETASECSGKNWTRIDEQPKSKATPKTTTKRKKDVNEDGDIRNNN